MVTIIFSLLAAAAPALALEGPLRMRAADFGEAVEGVERLLSNGASDASVKAANDHLAARFPRVTPLVEPALRGWDQEPVTGAESDLKAIMTESRQRLSRSRAVPPPELISAYDRAAAMVGQQRVDFDATLDDHEMGMFRYERDKVHEGTIGLNTFLKYIGAKVGHAFAAATLFHELGHAGDHDLAGKKTIDGEVPALKLSYHWLVFIDPRGERLALLRAVLADEMRQRPNPLTRMALGYATSLDVLRGTGGKDKELRDYAVAVGYRDGDSHHHEAAAPPSSPDIE